MDLLVGEIPKKVVLSGDVWKTEIRSDRKPRNLARYVFLAAICLGWLLKCEQS